MREQGRGSIINTASFVAVMGAATSQISYTASKGGVLAMSRELGVQFAREGIRVNALCPGPVDTPLLRELFAKDPERAARRLVHIPMGRFADATEIANAVLFLASDESSFVTASTFLVDGGISGGLRHSALTSEAAGAHPGVRLAGEDALHRLDLLRLVPGEGRVEVGARCGGVVGGQFPLQLQVLAAGRAAVHEGRVQGREGRAGVAHVDSLTGTGDAEASAPHLNSRQPATDFPRPRLSVGSHPPA